MTLFTTKRVKIFLHKIFTKNTLLQESFHEHKKVFACGKLPRRRKNICMQKISLMKEKSLLVENFLDEEKIFACGKLP